MVPIFIYSLIKGKALVKVPGKIELVKHLPTWKYNPGVEGITFQNMKRYLDAA